MKSYDGKTTSVGSASSTDGPERENGLNSICVLVLTLKEDFVMIIFFIYVGDCQFTNYPLSVSQNTDSEVVLKMGKLRIGSASSMGGLERGNGLNSICVLVLTLIPPNTAV